MFDDVVRPNLEPIMKRKLSMEFQNNEKRNFNSDLNDRSIIKFGLFI